MSNQLIIENEVMPDADTVVKETLARGFADSPRTPEEIEKARQFIENYDFSMVANRLRRHYKNGGECMEPDEIESTFPKFKGYLLSLYVWPDAPASPTKEQDSWWHAFILHTVPYGEFCQALYGKFIDHVPMTHVVNG